jgi:hypothetical protein
VLAIHAMSVPSVIQVPLMELTYVLVLVALKV